MSADNVIYVKKIKKVWITKGKKSIDSEWWVWEDFASNDNPMPFKNGKHFVTEEEAMQYAKEYYDKQDVVEYGIVPLTKDIKSKRTEEIDEIIHKLKTLWLKYPEQRLGQLLENYVFTEGERGDSTSISMFYQSDADAHRTISDTVEARTVK